MFLCEAFLMTIILMLGIYVTYTDIRNGIIQNKALLFAIIVGIVINIIYYGAYARDFLQIYIVNLLVMIIFAIILYGFHFWAAGDSKLLICVNFLFPARFYDNEAFSIAPGINAIVFIFMIAYGYIITPFPNVHESVIIAVGCIKFTKTAPLQLIFSITFFTLSTSEALL